MSGERCSMMTDAQLSSMLDHLGQGVYFADHAGRILYWNRGAEAISGHRAEEVVGRYCGEVLAQVDDSGRPLCGEGCLAKSVMSAGEARQALAWLRHRAGHLVPVSIESMPYWDAATGLSGVAEVFRDNTAGMALLKRANDLEQLAQIDPLTQIGNRRFAEQVLHRSWDGWVRNRSSFGIAILDIDYFKAVNDNYGHDAGDEVLRSLSRTLAGSLRSFDFLGRWGGEEILAIIQCVRPAALLRLSRRFLGLVRATNCQWGEHRIQVTVSVGVAAAEECGSVAELLLLADQRLYGAKHAGRDRLIGPEKQYASGGMSQPDLPASHGSQPSWS